MPKDLSPRSPTIDAAQLSEGVELSALESLSLREQQVLKAIVQHQIEKQAPVGSGALTDDLKVSSATIRAVMGNLQNRGLIRKPHSSAGRIPTDQGFRYYVDSLLKFRKPSAAEQGEIEARIQSSPGVEAALSEAGRVLSGLSRHACILAGPRPSSVRVRQIEFIRLRERALLVVLITTEGMVQNRLVELTDDEAKQFQAIEDPLVLARLARALTAEVEGYTLEEVRQRLQGEIAAGERELDALRETAARLSARALDTTAETAELLSFGATRLLDHVDESTLDRMRELLEVVQEKSRLAEMLELSTSAPGVQVFIGNENPAKELSDITLVTAPIAAPGGSASGQGEIFGSVGVIGPTRLDYARVVPLVELTATTIAKWLK